MLSGITHSLRLDAFDSRSNMAWKQGLERYQHSSYCREHMPHLTVWKKQQVKLLEIQPNAIKEEHANVILFIPSLINRNYILDLTDELSLARFMASQGHYVYLVDWDYPTVQDAHYDAADYVTEFLLPIISWLHERHGKAVMPVGYCVGGLLTLALAQLQPEKISRMALLATPWDFSKHQGTHGLWGAWQAVITESWCRAAPLVPGAYISWLFYLADPIRYEDKYSYFATLQQDSEAYSRFMAVEHWVNDAVPLTRAFARTCLIEWAQCNSTAEGLWRVGGEVIKPQQITCPALLVAPKRDHIVPPSSVMALAEALPHAYVQTPDTGHIGMIIGRTREQALWQPLADWAREH